MRRNKSFHLNYISMQLCFHVILIQSLYTVRAPLQPAVCILFTHFLKSKNVLSRGFFLKILALCMVSNQERVIVARVRYKKLNQFRRNFSI